MNSLSVGIVGVGHVGEMMYQLFPDAKLYDEPKNIGCRNDINECDVTFICVPTPMGKNGECNTSIVTNTIEWIESDLIIIRSTVPVGYTEQMVLKTGKKILFQPEYYGETVAHPFANPQNRSWITIGGRRSYYDKAIQVYEKVYTSEVQFKLVDSKTAELAKYMENCYLATKVTFCNEFYDIATALDIDYSELRETWLMDPRIGRSHTFVYSDNRGFGGSCLPKDISAMIAQGDNLGINTDLLKSVVKRNSDFKNGV